MSKKKSVKDTDVSPSPLGSDIFTSLLADTYAPDALILDKAHHVIYVHRNAGTYLKLPKKQNDFNLSDVLEGEELILIKKGIAETLKDKKPVLLQDVHWRSHTKDYVLNLKIRSLWPPEKNDPWVLIECHQNKDPQEFMAGMQDITALTQAQHQLRLSEERLTLAMNGASVGIWDWPDIRLPNIWWSPKFYELLGMYDGEMEAGDDNFKKLVHPDDYVATPEEVDQQEGKHMNAELRLFHKTEGYKWFRNSVQIFHENEGKVVRMIGSITDINKEKQAESQLTKINLQLKKANEYLDNFVFTVAHDLRSPVANLKSLVELFKLQVKAQDPIVSRIDLSVGRLEQTLRGLIQILDVQKVENKAAISITFSEVLEKILKELEEAVNNCHVAVHSDFKEEKINYIEPYLESIIRNLLSNSMKYARKEHTPCIFIRSEKDKEFILLEVEDNGIGIDLNRFKEKIFKPFEKLSHKSSGQGIGLHLIKTMVEKNGGKVEVQSHPDEGAIFKIYLNPYLKYERKKENTPD